MGSSPLFMRHLFLVLIISCSFLACKNSPTTTAITTKAAEQSHPDDFLKVNFEVHRNLLGKKIVEGEVINTGKYLTYKSVTLKISGNKDGESTQAEYTVSDTIAPGGHASFRYKPEGNQEQLKVTIASAITE